MCTMEGEDRATRVFRPVFRPVLEGQHSTSAEGKARQC